MAINGTLALTQRLCMTFVSTTACQHQPFWRWACCKREMMNNFAWVAITLFRIFGASQVCFGSLNGCYQHGYYCRECLYSQDSEEKLAFSLWLHLRCHIAQLGMFSVNPGIVVSFYASAHHPYTTLAIDEWMIFWPSKDSPIEVGSTECSRHLVFESSLHVRLLTNRTAK